MRSYPIHPKTILCCAFIAAMGGGCDGRSGSNNSDIDAFGFTELHRAARADDMDRVSELLLHGADPNARDEGGVTPIHRAARDGKYDLATELVRYSANLDVKTNTGWTPLHLAIRSGDVEMVNLLLDFGASPHIQLPDKMSPLMLAVSQDNSDIVNSILVRAETPDASGKTLDVNAKDANGDTPLHLAARKKNTDTAIALLAAGADPTAPNNARETPFYIAVHGNTRLLVTVMLQNGASVNSKTPNGLSIMNYAEKHAGESMIELLAHFLPENQAATGL